MQHMKRTNGTWLSFKTLKKIFWKKLRKTYMDLRRWSSTTRRWYVLSESPVNNKHIYQPRTLHERHSRKLEVQTTNGLQEIYIHLPLEVYNLRICSKIEYPKLTTKIKYSFHSLNFHNHPGKAINVGNKPLIKRLVTSSSVTQAHFDFPSSATSREGPCIPKLDTITTGTYKVLNC